MASTSESRSTNYYRAVNFQFMVLNLLHVPVALLTAYLAGGSFTLALAVGFAIAAGPAFFTLRNPEALESSIANAIALVSFSALLIHLSGGMTELHFHIFSALGVMIVLAQPLAVLAALLVVVVHHLGFFFFLPASLINYNAGFGILVIHAVFALAIGVPAIYISMKFKLYIVGVKEIIDEIQTIAGSLENSSASLVGTSDTLAQSIEKEASAMEQTSASLVEFNAMIARNSAEAQKAASNASASKERSTKSLAVVDSMVTALGEIQKNSHDVVTAVDNSNSSMAKILNLISEIESKTKVINDIVFQTKLLSFNASVEAARAGEHGKGFSVVAEEVGNLAAMSGKSAKEIETLLSSSIQDVKAIIDRTRNDVSRIVDDGKKKIEDSLRIAADCKNMLSEIDSQIGNVASSADQIASASKEQAAGASEISRAVSQVQIVTQENTAVSEASTKVATSLSSDSKNLNASIERLINAVQSGSKKKVA